MMLLRRRPREVYRVYSEEEYLNGAGSEPAMVLAEEWPVAVEPARNGAGERRLRRVAGMAMLAGAVGTVGGVVAANNPWAHRGAGRRPGSLVAATRASRIVRSISDPASAPPPSPTLARTSGTTRSRAARRRGASPTLPGRLPTHLHARQRGGSDIRPRGGVAIVVEDSLDAPAGGSTAPSPSAGETTVAASSADEATTPVSANAATARAGTGTQAEFGFER